MFVTGTGAVTSGAAVAISPIVSAPFVIEAFRATEAAVTARLATVLLNELFILKQKKYLSNSNHILYNLYFIQDTFL